MTAMTTMPTALEMREVTLPTTLALELEMFVSTEPDELSSAMTRAFGTLMDVVASNNLSVAGPPRTIYESSIASSTHCIAAIPILNAPDRILSDTDVKFVSIPGQSALRFTHHGPYASVWDTHAQVDACLRERDAFETEADWSGVGPRWEEYVGDPTTAPEQELMTHIYVPLP